MVIPRAEAGTGITVLVGGTTAIGLDFSHILSSKLLLFIAVVVFLGFLLLMAVFRSLLIPLVASIMNLLSVGAALGLMNAVFEWGWGKSLFRISATSPVEVFVPVLLISILFGLSMDYEVFLVSRMREEWAHGSASGDAVTVGQAASGRVITAAASIMILVFASFASRRQRRHRAIRPWSRRRHPDRRIHRPYRARPVAHARVRPCELVSALLARPGDSPPQHRRKRSVFVWRRRRRHASRRRTGGGDGVIEDPTRVDHWIGRPRDPRLSDAALSAALSIIVEEGYPHLTMERVAERASVSRTALYRRWPNKVDLAVEAISFFADTYVPLPDSGSLHDDVVEFLRSFVHTQSSRVGLQLAEPALSATGASRRAETRGQWPSRRLLDDGRARSTVASWLLRLMSSVCDLRAGASSAIASRPVATTRRVP